MRHRTPPRLHRLVVAISVLLFASQVIYAQTGGTIDLSWHVLSSGGASASSGGAATLGGSLGQFGAGTSLGGTADLTGGFWNAASGGTLAVTLVEFSAVQQGDMVLVTWETASELDNRGFNLYRGVSPNGWDRQLNEYLIPSQSQGSPSGFIYTWEDRADLLPDTTYYYWLEDVDISGATMMHGPVSVDFSVPTAVEVTGLAASSTRTASSAWLAAFLAALTGAALIIRRYTMRGHD